MTSISQERSKLAAVGQTLRRRDAWGARRSYTDANAVNEPASRVFVHISVTNPSSYNSDDAHARSIEAIGISRFPNTGISYNRLLMRSGKAYEGQPIGRRGAHTVNDFRRSTCSTSGCPGRGGSLSAPDWNLNYNARAYVICQNTPDSVTDVQLEALARAIAADKLAGFVTRGAQLHGHRCVSSKSCPGDKMWSRMGELEKKVNNYLANGLDNAPTGDWFDMADVADLKKAIREVLNEGGQVERYDPDTGKNQPDAYSVNNTLYWIHRHGRQARDEIVQTIKGDDDKERTMKQNSEYARRNSRDSLASDVQQLVKLNAIQGAVGADIDEAAIAQQVAALITQAVIESLVGVVQLTPEQVEQAVRNVLGSLDE